MAQSCIQSRHWLANTSRWALEFTLISVTRSPIMVFHNTGLSTDPCGNPLDICSVALALARVYVISLSSK